MRRIFQLPLLILVGHVGLAASSWGQCTPDVFEPNDTPATASDLGVTVSTTGQALGSQILELPLGDEDYHKITLPAGTSLRVSFTDLSALYAGDIRGRLLDANGGLLSLASSYLVDGEVDAYWHNTDSQDLDLIAHASLEPWATAASCNRYRISWEILPQPCQFQQGPDDWLEPNNLCDLAANPLLGNGHYSDLYASALNRDYYAVELDPGESLTATVIFDYGGMPTSENVLMALWATCDTFSNNWLASTGYASQSTASITYLNATPQRTRYVLGVWGGPGSAFYNYPLVWNPYPYFAGCNSYDLDIAITDASNSVSYCFGNGSSSAFCPCGNNSSPLHPGGCAHAVGDGAILSVDGDPRLSNDTLRFTLASAPPLTTALLVSGDRALPAPSAIPSFGDCASCGTQAFDGLRCAGGNLRRHGTRMIDSQGVTPQPWGAGATSPGILQASAFTAGQTRHFFAFFRTDPSLTCQQGQNSSNGVRVTFLP